MKDALNNYPMALDVAQVAEILNVTQATVRRHIKKHEIPAIKVGSLVRVPKDRLIEYLNGNNQRRADV